MTESTQRLLVIEPNLRSLSGHYAEFVRALGRGADKQSFDVYAHPMADGLLSTMSGVKVDTTEPRVGRLLAEFRVLGRSVRKQHPFLVLTSDGRHTATTSIISFLCGTNPRNAVFYFHRMPTGIKLILLQLSLRAKKKSLAIVPTEKIASELRKLGWAHVVCHPYPVLSPSQLPQPVPFRHLLAAGAARINKGLDLITGMLLIWTTQQRNIPLLMQISKKRAKKHGRQESRVLTELLSCGYSSLNTDENAVDREEYCNRFKGALVLAPYHRQRFADAVSGVVLEALLHGAPVIATRGTWPGNQVDRFNAGITISEHTPQALSAAVDQILANWETYSTNACKAAGILSQEHDPRLLFNCITRDLIAVRPSGHF